MQSDNPQSGFAQAEEAPVILLKHDPDVDDKGRTYPADI